MSECTIIVYHTFSLDGNDLLLYCIYKRTHFYTCILCVVCIVTSRHLHTHSVSSWLVNQQTIGNNNSCFLVIAQIFQFQRQACAFAGLYHQASCCCCNSLIKNRSKFSSFIYKNIVVQYVVYSCCCFYTLFIYFCFCYCFSSSLCMKRK